MSGWSSQAVIATQVIIEGSDDGLWVYSGIPASGNLIASIAASEGTDQYGNAYLAGFTSYVPGGGVVNLDGAAIAFAPLVNDIADAGNISGEAGLGLLTINSGIANAADTPAQITLASAADSGTSFPVVGCNGSVALYDALAYAAAADGGVPLVFQTPTGSLGASVQNGFAGAVPEVLTDTSAIASGNVTSPVLITKAYGTDSFTLTAGTTFTLKTWFNGVSEVERLIIYADIAGAATQLAELGADFVSGVTAGDSVSGSLELEVLIVSATTCRLSMCGVIQDTTMNSGIITDATICPITSAAITGVSIAAGDTVGLAVAFAASAAGQTIQTQGSRFTRSGP